MKIIDDLLSSLDGGVPVRDIRLGFFYTGVWARGCGLSATVPRDVLAQDDALIGEPGLLLEKDSLELASMVHSQHLLEATVGMAAINACITIEERYCTRLNAGDLIAEKGENKRVAMVGHFPFVSSVRTAARELWVFEKNPREGDFTEAEAGKYLPAADVVGITGTALVNKTIEKLLTMCSPSAFIILIGGTAPLSPVLFEYGIDAVAGTRVVDPERTLRCISQGATYRQLRGIEKLVAVSTKNPSA